MAPLAVPVAVLAYANEEGRSASDANAVTPPAVVARASRYRHPFSLPWQPLPVLWQWALKSRIGSRHLPQLQLHLRLGQAPWLMVMFSPQSLSGTEDMTAVRMVVAVTTLMAVTALLAVTASEGAGLGTVLRHDVLLSSFPSATEAAGIHMPVAVSRSAGPFAGHPAEEACAPARPGFPARHQVHLTWHRVR